MKPRNKNAGRKVPAKSVGKAKARAHASSAVVHPDTLTRRNNLAFALNAQGKNAETEAEHRARIAIGERVLGAEHPDVAISYYNLAICLEAPAQGARAKAKKAEALAFARRALAIRKKILGDGHPATQRAQAVLADLEKP